jgi:hypothetical protein
MVGGMAQVVESLHNKGKALSSNPNTAKTKRNKQKTCTWMLIAMFYFVVLVIIFNGLTYTRQVFYHWGTTPVLDSGIQNSPKVRMIKCPWTNEWMNKIEYSLEIKSN